MSDEDGSSTTGVRPMMPGRNGRGLLRRGGPVPANHRRGGRLPNELRERLRKSLWRDIPHLERVARGDFLPRLPDHVLLSEVCICGAYVPRPEEYPSTAKKYTNERRGSHMLAPGAQCTCTAQNNPALLCYALADMRLAIEIKARYGLGTTFTALDSTGRDAPVGPVFYLPENGRPDRTRGD